MLYQVLITIIVILLMIILCIILYYRMIIKRFSKELSDTLDDMISDKEIEFHISSDRLMDKLHSKLKRLYEILLDKKEEALRQRKELQTLVTDISHQVKTPIANLKIYNDILDERELTSKDQKSIVEKSSKQLDKLDFLMQTMIKMSRLETGLIVLKPIMVPIQEILAQALSGIYLQAENKQISITVDCDDTILSCCDKKWTAEAIFNILENGVKYIHQGGNIDISVEKQEFYTLIRIQDNGMGISEEDSPKIYQRFYRGTQAQKEEGMGVGLYLTREIISKQNGYIKLKSNYGKGTEFCVFLSNE